MAKQTLTFGYTIGDRVRIVRGGAAGVVIGLYCDRDGIKSFLVEYVDAIGRVETLYRRLDELEPLSGDLPVEEKRRALGQVAAIFDNLSDEADGDTMAGTAFAAVASACREKALELVGLGDPAVRSTADEKGADDGGE